MAIKYGQAVSAVTAAFGFSTPDEFYDRINEVDRAHSMILVLDQAATCDRIAHQLAAHAIALQERMAQLTKRVAEQGALASFNPLGEVQGLAHDVDRLCAELHCSLGFLEVAVNLVGGRDAKDKLKLAFSML